MSKVRVYALTMDRAWGKMMEEVSDASFEVIPICCPEGYPNCLENLPSADHDALLLLDATGLRDVAGMVRRLRCLGWRFVVVVAADPTHKEAKAAFKAGASDYQSKTLSTSIVRSQVRTWAREAGFSGTISY